ncbi:MAG: hypothetical protein ACOCZ6_05040, partial [Nanoarchaeota archaeon]
LDIQTSPSPEIDPQHLIQEDLKPVKVYVESCLDQVTAPIVKNIASGGGTLTHDRVRFFEDVGYRYLCEHTDNKCINKILKREDMEKEISRAVERDLESCVDLSIFREQGFRINTSKINANTTIILDEVKVKVNYPMLFEKGSKSMRIEDFSSTVKEPLGKMYLLANSVINQELSNGYFDHVEFMKEDGVEVEIKKKRPYPDVTYSLTSDGLTFNFALEGVDTASQIDFLYTPIEMEKDGCCYISYDSSCYKNVPRILCEEEDGVYDPNKDCTCPALEPSGVEPELDFRDCETTYNITSDDFTGPKKEHGESWCNYGSVAGSGKDYVGSRHYLHYCIDGKEYVEECRDYREEICTQEKKPGGTTNAVCRTNRWEDCSDSKTKETCKDSEYRDCVWKENIFEDGRCVPEVPPGLKFWEESGGSVCSLASQEKECTGFSCGDDWLTNSAELCIYQGDCGNYRNIDDVLTKEGFYHTDQQAEINEDIYNKKGLHLEGYYPWLDLSLSDRDRTQLTDLDPETKIEINSLEPSTISDIIRNRELDFLTIEETSERFLVEFRRDLKPRENFLQIMSSVYSYLDGLSRVSLAELKEDNADVTVKNTALCDIWRAPPSTDDCSACHESDMYTCTEYICNSLGKNCVYEEGFGRGRCHSIEIDDKTPPDVSIDKKGLKDSYRVEEDELAIEGDVAKGYKITEGVSPLERISFGLTSDKKTTCKMSYMPKIGEANPAGFYISSTGFDKEHKININVPPKPEIPQRLLDFINASDSAEFIELFTENKEKIEELEEEGDFKEIFEKIFGEEFYEPGKMPDLVKLISSDIDEYRQISKKVFNALEKGEIYLFFYCQDRAGNKNEMPEFLRIPIDNRTIGEEPPEILGTEPENEEKFAHGKSEIDIKFYLSEPSICRYAYEDMDYEEMNKTMDCTISRFNIETEHGGSYLCRSKVEANETIELYVRCRDNPERFEEFDFNIKRIPTLTNHSSIKLDKRTIEQESIKTDANNTKVVFYLDDPMNCSLAYSPGKESSRRCGPANNLDRGQYKCVFEMSTNESVYEELAKKEKGNVSEDEVINKSNEEKNNNSFETINDEINDTNNITKDKPTYLPYNISSNILCRDREGENVNINQESFVYEIQMSDELEIVNHAPRGDIETQDPAIVVETSPSEDINCGYYDKQETELRKMESLQGNRFSGFPGKVSKGLNKYTVICRDVYGNEAEKEISFYYTE